MQAMGNAPDNLLTRSRTAHYLAASRRHAVTGAPVEPRDRLAAVTVTVTVTVNPPSAAQVSIRFSG